MVFYDQKGDRLKVHQQEFADVETRTSYVGRPTCLRQVRLSNWFGLVRPLMIEAGS